MSRIVTTSVSGIDMTDYLRKYLDLLCSKSDDNYANLMVETENVIKEISDIKERITKLEANRS